MNTLTIKKLMERSENKISHKKEGNQLLYIHQYADHYEVYFDKDDLNNRRMATMIIDLKNSKFIKNRYGKI
jgi:hypothetical protein